MTYEKPDVVLYGSALAEVQSVTDKLNEEVFDGLTQPRHSISAYEADE